VLIETSESLCQLFSHTFPFSVLPPFFQALVPEAVPLVEALLHDLLATTHNLKQCREQKYRGTQRILPFRTLPSSSSSTYGLPMQGCRMVYFQTKKSQLGKFWRALQWKMFVYFTGIGVLYGILIYLMDILNVLWQFGIFPRVLVYCTKKNLATLLRWSRVAAVPSEWLGLY
jgi:hypothetical protein